MKKYTNGEYIEMTESEIAEIESRAESDYTESKSADMTDSEKLSLLLSTITEDKSNKGDNGECLTKPVIKDGVIVYLPTSERIGTGTYDDPMGFVDGDSVTAGMYYCRQIVTAKGTITRQLTSGTYKAYSTKDDAVWAKMTDFEFVY